MRKLLPVAAVAALGLGTSAIPALAATARVSVKDDVFKAKSLTVAKGTKVVWKWVGNHPHNVTVKSGPARFASPTKASGTFSRKLTKKGTYRIVCTIHPGMAMTIKVR